MAKQGTYTAYQRLTPIAQDFGDDLQQAERMGFAYRREEAARKKAIDEENQKFLDDFSESASGLKPFDTKVRNVNEVVARALTRAKEDLPNLYKRYSDKSLSMSERIDAKMAINEIEKLPEYLKEMTGGLTQYVTANDKAIADGTLLPTNEYSNLNDLFSYSSDGKEMDIVLDKNYQPVLAYKNGEGKINSISFGDYMDKNLPKNVRNMDFDAMVLADSKLMGTITNVNEKGLRKNTTKGANQESLNALDSRTEKLFFIDDNGRPSDALFATMVKAGRNPYNITENDVKEARDLYKERVLATVDTENKSEFDNSTALGYARLNKDEEKGELTIVTDEQTGKPSTTEMYDNGVATGIKGTAITNKQGQPFILDKTKNSETRADNIFLGDDGFIYADVENVRIEGTETIEMGDGTFKEIKGKETITPIGKRKLTPTEAGNLAKDRGYQNATEMIDDLKGKINQMGGSESPVKFN